ncbi:MAG: class I tRNA ligase family protein [Patescibacteria group bacterium]
MKQYNHRAVERKWQGVWEKKKFYGAADKSKKPKFYGLVEFPYPSGEGLHVGHVRSYTGMDVIARKRRAEGHNVLYPIGWDAFGLPTENYAIKTGQDPRAVTKKNSDNFRRQLKALGLSFDWSREINTSDPNYYRFTQWIFLQFFKRGLAYKAKVPINWCPKDKIGLANEEVVDGKCERCGAAVEPREKEQWMLAITKYADRLAKDLDLVNYPESIKVQQRNWIGRSEGWEIEFKINPTPNPSPKGRGINSPSFGGGEGEVAFGYQTTDPKIWRALQDKTLEMRKNSTEAENVMWQMLRNNSLDCHFRRQHIIGKFIVDFVCLEKKLVIEVDGDIHDYQKEEDRERTEFLEIEGYKVIRFRNEEAVQNISSVKNKIAEILKALSFGEGLGGVIKIFTTRPETIYGATFVAITGKTDRFTGEYAINPANQEKIPIWEAEYVMKDVGTGAIMGVPARDTHDLEFAKKHGLPVKEAPMADQKIWTKIGVKPITTYKLRDWVFSRQRYWGEPIPIIHCAKCGIVPVPEEDLPVKLPKVKNYKPTDNGDSPLANIASWVNVACPRCGDKAKRETDVMPNWAGSSWYYLAYVVHKPKSYDLKAKRLLKKWLPVDWYNGGMEHTTLHLLYSRFWHKVLYDLKLVPGQEPYQKRTAHGFILAADGEKMSKSRGNVVNPDEVIKLYGADTLRLYEMFMGPFGQAVSWQTESIIGVRRFLEKVFRYSEKRKTQNVKQVTPNQKLNSLINETVKKVSADIEAMKFNTAVSQLMICANHFAKAETVVKKDWETFLILLAPFAPHLTEELWATLGHRSSIQLAPWPAYDERQIQAGGVIAVQINGKTRATIGVVEKGAEGRIKELALENPVIKKWLIGKTINKMIYVKGRLINIVVE